MDSLMTEKEANARRCLMLELIQAVHVSTAPGGSESPVGCIASNCMWWRWTEKDRQLYGPRGYCGLAARPDYE